MDSMSEVANTQPETEPYARRERTRDDFPKRVIDALARRVGFLCSNPNCPAPHTSGPHSDDAKFVNLGVASHITAASMGGPRFDAVLTPDERRSIYNGIWLCQGCSVLIDRDAPAYSAELLREWKGQAENAAELALRGVAVRPKRKIEQADRNRHAMIEKVRTIWIRGFLQKSLYLEVRVLLGLSERPDAVERPFDLLVIRPDEGERPLPAGTRVVEIYDSMDEILLILGAPGSGKTTELLELAQELLKRADDDPGHPIPVIFPLSTWAETRKTLPQWLEDELNLRYDVPRKIAHEWIASDQVIPMLDGLDEVKAEHRDGCGQAISEFRQSHGFLPIIVTSRTADYEALTKPLRLQGRILVRPLTRDQVNLYLTNLGQSGESVRAALHEDRSLWDLLDSPLMLNVVTVSYATGAETPVLIQGTLAERRDQLFGLYVNRMLRRRAAEWHYTPEHTVQWLSLLANRIEFHGQTVFYVKQIHVDGELPYIGPLPVVRYAAIVGLFAGLLFALITSLFVGATGVISGMTLGMSSLLPFFFRDKDFRIPTRNTYEFLDISWSAFPTSVPAILVATLVCSLTVAVCIGLIVGWEISIAYGLLTWAPIAVYFCIRRSLSFAWISVLPPSKPERRRLTTLGILVSFLVIPICGLCDIMRVSLSSGWRSRQFVVAVLLWLFPCIVCALVVGGERFLKGSRMRLWLMRTVTTPTNLARLIDYAADRILLRKVGGGYMFIHRMLLEWFAARYVEAGTVPKKDLSSGDHHPA